MKHYFIKLTQVLVCLIAFVIFTDSAYAQELMNVTGTITDSSNETLPGVTVMVKGKNEGAVTDFEGKYSVRVAKGDVLVFSCIGFLSQEKMVNSNTLDVSMEVDTKDLDEVVVVGYGVQKKSSVTGAISQVKSEDIENRTITTAEQALQGKTAGVQIIQTSGSPGAEPQVRVRGYSSNASSSPLYVVDGVRVRSISNIDPNDIESMEVLKDAASAAIYGAEAGNGVILITTRKGAGSGKISYSYQLSMQSLENIPSLMNAQEYKNYMTEGGYILESVIDQYWDGKTSTDWIDVAFENSSMQRHNLSFSSGSERGSYYLSFSALSNDWIVTGNRDVYDRYTASINADHKIKSWIKVGTTNQLTYYKAQSVSENNEYGSMLTSVMQMDPLTPDVYGADNLTPEMQAVLDAGTYDLLTNDAGQYYSVSPFFVAEQYHPIIMRDQTTSKRSGAIANGSIYGDFTPVKWLTFTSRLGYRISASRSSTYDHPYYGNSRFSREFAGISSTNSTTYYYQWENFANAHHSFGKHNLNLMLGTSFQKTSSDNVYVGLTPNGEHAITKDDPNFGFINFYSPTANRNIGGELLNNARTSYFGRFGYDYDGKYMFQASMRADAADLSYLAKESRWGYFPAVSAGWTTSNENFFEPVKDVVSFLKVRASWGQNGSLAGLGSYAYGNQILQSGMYVSSAPNDPTITYINSLTPSSMGNPDLKWETSVQTNIGIDARLLNDRLTFTFDYFDKRTKDLIVNGTTPTLSIGGTMSPVNAGDVKNTGLEFELGWKSSIKDFKYSINANLATISNEVTYLDRSLSRLTGTIFQNKAISFFEEGYPVYYFRGYKFSHIDSATGDAVFFDKKGEKTFTPTDEDMEYIGDAIPDFTYGITITAQYKGFDFTAFGTGSHGNDIFNCVVRPDQGTGNKLSEVFYDNRWTATNTNASAPRPGSYTMNSYYYSDAMVFSGSYFKIKQLQLGYSLPKNLVNRIGLGRLRVYVSLDDFFVFTKYPGFDPEASAGSAMSAMGIDKGSYPTSKKVVFGLNVEF